MKQVYTSKQCTKIYDSVTSKQCFGCNRNEILYF